ncbi:hypothetical protein I552_0241 [Mycobacterium xenopi 3993]|nr:hypothetical protein I552_0241 [Mycobacterium xenopi 3993]
MCTPAAGRRGDVLRGLGLLGHIPYRIDIDVYQMGARAWLDNRPLYKDVLFHTPIGLNLPFTYPPLAAIVFCPFAWLRMPAASVAITCTTLVLLVVSIMIVLTRLEVWTFSRLLPDPPGGGDGGWRWPWWRPRRSGWSRSNRTSPTVRSTSC